ncbi:MAG: oligoribonuclease [endosymbiont of Seepiophila jonesi]|uniref:Oligoribonuclease n=1 Tax=endosymbiont of Lamellibrachia luymesi TaxID=2200907 RepID=A0A370DUC4_9GAMM|nr:MAG: oligoribonuclease [endosymbiont of Lamellibrachia luymesi]RDH92572.1 MAG: oligoribonuclease [endosymbiont of Seepiophila jonesi]
MTQDSNNLIWLDLEMTGLDTVNDEIIEIATIVTDADLNILAEGPAIAVRQSEALLDGMDEWNQKQHGGSGLIARVRESERDEAAAEAETLEFLQQYVPAGASPMCGNSICQDRRFMSRTMPKLEDYFHYRNLDVSTLKELAKRWAPDMADGFTKESKHLAIDDIRDSIAELKFYSDNFLRLS